MTVSHTNDGRLSRLYVTIRVVVQYVCVQVHVRGHVRKSMVLCTIDGEQPIDDLSSAQRTVQTHSNQGLKVTGIFSMVQTVGHKLFELFGMCSRRPRLRPSNGSRTCIHPPKSATAYGLWDSFPSIRSKECLLVNVPPGPCTAGVI